MTEAEKITVAECERRMGEVRRLTDTVEGLTREIKDDLSPHVREVCRMAGSHEEILFRNSGSVEKRGMKDEHIDVMTWKRNLDKNFDTVKQGAIGGLVREAWRLVAMAGIFVIVMACNAQLRPMHDERVEALLKQIVKYETEATPVPTASNLQEPKRQLPAAHRTD